MHGKRLHHYCKHFKPSLEIVISFLQSILVHGSKLSRGKEIHSNSFLKLKQVPREGSEIRTYKQKGRRTGEQGM